MKKSLFYFVSALVFSGFVSAAAPTPEQLLNFLKAKNITRETSITTLESSLPKNQKDEWMQAMKDIFNKPGSMTAVEEEVMGRLPMSVAIWGEKNSDYMY